MLHHVFGDTPNSFGSYSYEVQNGKSVGGAALAMVRLLCTGQVCYNNAAMWLTFFVDACGPEQLSLAFTWGYVTQHVVFCGNETKGGTTFTNWLLVKSWTGYI